MERIINLNSRGIKNYLELIESDGILFKYKLNLEIPSYRVGYTDDGNYWIDPSGGPLMVINGGLLEAENSIIKNIEENNNGLIITLKKLK